MKRLALLVAVPLVGAALALGAAAAPASAGMVTSDHPAVAAAGPTPAAYQAGLAHAIWSDVAASATLPATSTRPVTNLWVFGDAVSIYGKSWGAYGYPHSEFGLQIPGQPVWNMVHSPWGYGYQVVPNFCASGRTVAAGCQPDGTYFWAGGIVIRGPTVWVYGARIRGIANFSVVSSEVAWFSAASLKFEGVASIPGPDLWGSSQPAAGGFWLTGTHGVPCSYAQDCAEGDLAFVPTGDEARPWLWSVHYGVFPASLNIGTVISPVRTAAGFAVWTKMGDAYGSSVIERLTAPSMTGPWSVSPVSIAVPEPQGVHTYSVELHATPGGLVVTWAQCGPGICYPGFAYEQP